MHINQPSRVLNQESSKNLASHPYSFKDAFERKLMRFLIFSSSMKTCCHFCGSGCGIGVMCLPTENPSLSPRLSEMFLIFNFQDTCLGLRFLQLSTLGAACQFYRSIISPIPYIYFSSWTLMQLCKVNKWSLLTILFSQLWTTLLGQNRC